MKYEEQICSEFSICSRTPNFHYILTRLNKLFKCEFERGELEKSRNWKRAPPPPEIRTLWGAVIGKGGGGGSIMGKTLGFHTNYLNIIRLAIITSTPTIKIENLKGVGEGDEN